MKIQQLLNLKYKIKITKNRHKVIKVNVKMLTEASLG